MILPIIAFLVLLAVRLPSTLASENGLLADDAVEVHPVYETGDQVVIGGSAAPVVDANPSQPVNASVLPTYEIDCTEHPDICQNWCYYVFCKQKGVDGSSPAWTVTVDRNAHNRRKGECGIYKPSPNKCSTVSNRGNSPWPANPASDLDCDEQPKSSNREGGAGAATRCIDSTQNRSEGTRWRNFINKSGAVVDNGKKVLVVLKNHSGKGVCASLSKKGSTVCPAPASPKDKDVKTNVIRQQ